MNQKHIFTRAMVESWNHSEACLGGDPNKCICGLTALQGEVASSRTSFALQSIPFVSAAGSQEKAP